MGLAFFNLTSEDKGQTDEAVGALDGFVGLGSSLADGIDDVVEMGFIDGTR